jgi:hypothetical protein
LSASGCTPPNEEAADYLENVVNAIRERRLFGFMMQESAESAVAAGDWIEKTIEEVIAEARTENDRWEMGECANNQAATSRFAAAIA